MRLFIQLVARKEMDCFGFCLIYL